MLVNLAVENQPLTTKHRASLDDAYDAVELISRTHLPPHTYYACVG